MKKSKKIILAIVFVVIVAIGGLLVHIPEQVKTTMTVATSTGDTAEVDIDILYYSNLFFPSYVKGTISINGVEYTDRYTMLKSFSEVSDNRLFASDWWTRKESTPYNMTFLRSDCKDVNSALLNNVNVLDIVIDKGNYKIHLMYADESNQIDGVIKGISFWGPAQNSEEARQVAEFFEYQMP